MKIGSSVEALAGRRRRLRLQPPAPTFRTAAAGPKPAADRQTSPTPAELRRAGRRLADRPLVGRLWRRPALGPDRRGAEGLADARPGRGAAGLGQRRHHRRPRSALLPSRRRQRVQVATTEQSLIEGFPPFIQQLLPQGYSDNGRLALDALATTSTCSARTARRSPRPGLGGGGDRGRSRRGAADALDRRRRGLRRPAAARRRARRGRRGGAQPRRRPASSPPSGWRTASTPAPS